MSREFLVETIKHFKVRYKVTTETAEGALDEIVCLLDDQENPAVEELDQLMLNETITNIRVFTGGSSLYPIDPSLAARHLDGKLTIKGR